MNSDLDSIFAKVEKEGEGFCASYRNLRLGSAFQPILSLEHRRAVGFEALLRPRNSLGEAVSPALVFSSTSGEADSVALDRLSRLLHVKNFIRQQSGNSWLFLNIDPLVTVSGRAYGKFFEELLSRHEIEAHRLVIEILEGKIHDESLLAEAVQYYRDLGSLIAIDDFGAGHSNFDRIWRISPHIVKLDRSIIAQAAESRKVTRVLPNLVGLIHEAGSLALMEGIETTDEALIAMDSGIDLVQGFHFARPAPMLSHEQESGPVTRLFHRYRRFSADKAGRQQEKLFAYLEAFRDFAERANRGEDPALACSDFLKLPNAERCYLLDSLGRQEKANFSPPHRTSSSDPRFLPLMDASDAVWSRRHYFRRAVNSPGTVQVSRPYLSVAGGNLCVTLSISLGENMVLCGDISWQD